MQQLGYIYYITNTASNKVYVGQTKYKEERWNAHKKNLENGTHHNAHLQRSWGQHTPKDFVFSVAERVAFDVLEEAEEKHIQELRELGTITFNYSKKFGGIGEESFNSLLTEEIVFQVRKSLSEGVSRKEASKIYNILLSSIHDIASYRTWVGIAEEYREKIKEVTENRTFSEEARKNIRKAHSNIDEEVVEKVRLSLYNGSSKRDVCKKFSLSSVIVKQIAAYRTWKEICPELKEVVSKVNDRTKVKPEEIIEIKKLYSEGVRLKHIHEQFSHISKTNICDIINGKIWKDIGEITRDIKNYGRKLTIEDVIEIKRLWSEGVRLCEICKKFSWVNRGTIDSIVREKSWKHIETPELKRERPGQIKGEDIFTAKLTEEDVISIKNMALDGKSDEEISEIFSQVGPNTIYHIVRYHTWEYIMPECKEEILGLRKRQVSKEDVIEVKNSFLLGMSMKEISEKFGISVGVVGNIISGRTYKDVAPELREQIDFIRNKTIFSDSDVEIVREMRDKGMKYEEIGCHFNTGKTTVYKFMKKVNIL